jgi:hypothetical protein
MNWTRMSAIAEIVSSIAILATLGYLAVQTRQNTAALQSSSRQQSLAAELELIRMVLDYPDVAPGTAGDAATIRKGMISTALFRIREHQWFQFQDGRLDEATFRSYMRVLVTSLRRDDVMQRAWRDYSGAGSLDPDFVKMIDDALAGN